MEGTKYLSPLLHTQVNVFPIYFPKPKADLDTGPMHIIIKWHCKD